MKRRRKLSAWLALSVLVFASMFVASCTRTEKQSRVAYVPIAQLEQSYGRLITVANSPTFDQHGTGDRLGLFRDDNGTIWGLALTVGTDGSTLGCAPPNLHELAATDTLPADFGEIVGATNQPTGWRGGSGRLELLFRDAKGDLQWHSFSAAVIKTGPVCWSQSPPEEPLRYYRLVKD